MGIVLENISKSFDGKNVLDNFSLTVEYNEKISVMGESGSGKTTLLNIIAGIINPDTGTVSGIAGKRFGMVFQEDRLAEDLTVYRNIKLACGKNVDKTNIPQALEKVGLSAKLLNAKVNTLSGGMKRRVAILRALLCNADIILMDEPTKGLDEENKQIVIDYIINKSNGKTLIFVTHNREEAEKISDRIVLI